LSVLLGTHPPLLPVRVLVKTAGLFGISEGTTRVALSRLAAEGDVIADQASYRLSERLSDRQRRQDASRQPATRPWRGAWEMAVAGPGVRSASDLAELGSQLASLRLAELRAGVWMRPANLLREWPDPLDGKARRFEARPGAGLLPDRQLAETLWDLGAWARGAEKLLGVLKASDEPADQFIVSAAIVRHLQEDPLLPPALLPPGWPGNRLRSAYARTAARLASIIRDETARHDRNGAGLEDPRQK
jgi:phenylacetic acid degradation operon negative regulatory protein